MARLEYFLVSESISIDQSTNRTSLFNVLEDIHTEEFPIFIGDCVAVSLWRYEANDENIDYQITLVVTLPEIEPQDFQTNFKFPEGSKRHRVVQRFGGISIKAPGDVCFELRLNNEHIAEHIVSIHPAASSAT